MTKLALFLTLPAILVAGQIAPPAVTAETAKKATIEGVVVNESTREPLRRAEVSLQRAGKQGMMFGADNSAYSAVTDAAGKFRIEGIEPGEYYLIHHKTGYVNPRSHFGDSARLLKLAAGESLTDLHYSLLPQAIVTGRVLDDEGEPVQGASVMLMHSRTMRGSPRMVPAGQAQTNDRGEYRLINVQPGKYFIQANVQRMMMAGGGPPVPSGTSAGPRTAFVSTYYPSAVEIAQATKVEAQAGLELSGQDITLRKEKVVKVSGKVLGADGTPAKQTYVVLMAEDGFPFFSNAGTMVDPQGNFTLKDVRPGQYIAMATRMQDQSPQMVHVPVVVGDTDLANVALQLQPGLEAKGSIVLEGSDQKDFDFSRFALRGEPAGSAMFGNYGAEVKADGTFSISQLSPGRYTISVHPTNGVEGYVQSIQVGGEDVYGKEVDAAALAAGGIRVVVRLDSAKVVGTIEVSDDAKAHPRSSAVVLLPADAKLRNGNLLNLTQPDQTNSFELKNVRPGEYLAFAFEQYDAGALEDPEVVAAIESKATKVSLGRGESKQLALKLMPWPEQFADRLQ